MDGMGWDERVVGVCESGNDKPTRKRLRHGRWRLFHLYQAFRTGESGFGDILSWCYGMGIVIKSSYIVRFWRVHHVGGHQFRDELR
jgi:hypothetical protein